MSKEPNHIHAERMAGELLAGPLRVERFQMGLKHYVFEAASKRTGEVVVVRVSRGEDVDVVRSALYWSALLSPMGVPLPKVLHADPSTTTHPFPFVILERLPGQDLGFVVNQLNQTAQLQLANRLIAIQQLVTDLPPGNGYGFAPRMEGPFLHASWQSAIAASLFRSRKRLRDAGVINLSVADRVEAAGERLNAYFDNIAATPFLHDITTKNVIVDGTRLSGIVDVDDLCFGDPLLLVGLIKVALLANGHDGFYGDAWVNALQVDNERRAALEFYTALFCLEFLSEIGHRFNRPDVITADAAYIARLRGFLDQHLT